MFKYLITILCFFLTFELTAQESLLTLKQQLDRLQREVSDLSQSVYKGARDQTFDITQDTNQLSNLTAFDLRIYDLEKDIKTLNESFEELIFQIDDLKKLYEELNLRNLTKLLVNDSNGTVLKDNNIISSEDSKNILSDKVNNENILGTLVINSEDLTNVIETEVSVAKNQEKKQDTNSLNTLELSPEEEFQKAFDMIRYQKFSEAKIALQDFIKKYQDDKLAGSAHYWLGEMYLLKKEYREAALILAEGYQKFPTSYKAPNMLFKLSYSLINIDKKKDACGTLEKLISEFPKSKLVHKAEGKLVSLNCISSLE